MEPVFSSDPEEERRLRQETLRAAQTLAAGGEVGSVPVVVGNLLAMYVAELRRPQCRAFVLERAQPCQADDGGMHRCFRIDVHENHWCRCGLAWEDFVRTQGQERRPGNAWEGLK